MQDEAVRGSHRGSRRRRIEFGIDSPDLSPLLRHLPVDPQSREPGGQASQEREHLHHLRTCVQQWFCDRRDSLGHIEVLAVAFAARELDAVRDAHARLRDRPT